MLIFPCTTEGKASGHSAHRAFITSKLESPHDFAYHATVISRANVKIRGHVAIFGTILDLSAPATSTRACLRRYLLRTVFAGKNATQPRCRPSFSRSSASQGNGEPHLRVPLSLRSALFRGDLQRSEAHARPRAPTLAFSPVPSYPLIFARINVHVSYYARRPVRARRTPIAICSNVIPPPHLSVG